MYKQYLMVLSFVLLIIACASETKLSHYSKAIVSNPNDSQAYLNRANAYRKLHRYNEAISDYSKAIELDNKNAKAFRYRGIAYLATNKIDSAISDFTTSITIDPTDPENYANRFAAYLFFKKDKDKAWDNFVLADSVGGGIEPHLLNSLENDRINDFNNAIALYPDLTKNYTGRGEVYLYKGKTEQALSDFEKALKLNLKESKAYYYIGLLYLKKANYGQSIFYLNQSLNIKKNAMTYATRGLVYALKKEHDNAKKDFQEALKVDPYCGMAIVGLERLKRVSY